MTAIISILIVIVSILLVIVVLIQNSKGGGLDSNLASKTQILGAGKTTEVVEKITWWLAGILIVLCVFSTKMVSGDATNNLPVETDLIENTDSGIEEEE